MYGAKEEAKKTEPISTSKRRAIEDLTWLVSAIPLQFLWISVNRE